LFRHLKRSTYYKINYIRRVQASVLSNIQSSPRLPVLFSYHNCIPTTPHSQGGPKPTAFRQLLTREVERNNNHNNTMKALLQPTAYRQHLTTEVERNQLHTGSTEMNQSTINNTFSKISSLPHHRRLNHFPPWKRIQYTIGEHTKYRY
jgi:hypothetical protein